MVAEASSSVLMVVGRARALSLIGVIECAGAGTRVAAGGVRGSAGLLEAGGGGDGGGAAGAGD